MDVKVLVFLLASSSPPVLVPLAQPGMAKASISASMNGLPGDCDRKEWRLAKETRSCQDASWGPSRPGTLALLPSSPPPPPPPSPSPAPAPAPAPQPPPPGPPFSNLSNSSGRMKTAVKGDKGGYKLLINNNQGNYGKQLHKYLVRKKMANSVHILAAAALHRPRQVCSHTLPLPAPKLPWLFFNTFFFCRCFMTASWCGSLGAKRQPRRMNGQNK